MPLTYGEAVCESLRRSGIATDAQAEAFGDAWLAIERQNTEEETEQMKAEGRNHRWGRGLWRGRGKF